MEQRKIGELFKRKRTMKNLFKSIMTVAVAAMAFASCSNNYTEEVSFGEKVQFTVNAVNDEITRSTFGEPADGKYPTLWEGNEEVIKVAINATKDATSTKTTVSDDKSTASFEVRIETGEVSAPYTFAALSPASAAVSGVNASYKSWNIEFPATQTPTANSCDPKAQILLGTSTTYETMPSSVDLSFKHLSAYAKFSFINLNLSNATVNSVVMESEKTIAYRHYYYLAGDNAGTFEDNNATKGITINTSSLENIWVGLAPTDVSNSKLTFTINTSAGTYKKEVTMPADRLFEAGKVSTFKVDMAGVELEGPVKYELLTNVANLTAGSKVIIAAAKANYAMSTNQKSSNRGAAAITKEGNYIVDPSSDVEIFTVEEGTEAGSYAFKGKDGYIYAASSSSNYLKTQDKNDANGSWKITIENAGTKLVAQGDKTRNVLQYNPNNGSPLFNCYASTSTDRELVAIYYIPAENQEPDTTPAIIPAQTAIEIAADEQYTDVALTLKNITEDVTVNWDTTLGWINDASVEDETLFINVDNNESTDPRTATFTLTANGAEATVTLTQLGAGSDEIQTITVAELLNKSVNANVWYKLTGTIKNIASTSYGNFDLVDETGTIYVYGLTETQVAKNDQSFSKLGLKENDIVTLIGTRAVYNETAQVGGPAYYVSHIASCIAPEISCKDNAVTITAEQGATIYYTVDGTTPTTASAVYSEPFAITATCTVKAFAVAQDKPDSIVASAVCEYVDPTTEVVKTATATLSFADIANRTHIATTQQVWEQNGIKLINDKGSSTTNIGDYYNPARFYKDSKITVTAPGNITKIEFVCNSSSYATALNSAITSSGNVSVSGSTVTVVPSSTAKSFVIAKLSGGQVRMNSLSVTYEVAE